MESVRWGVLGTARIAREQVIPGIRRSGRGEVVAVSSASGRAGAYAAELGIPKAYGSHDDLLADADIDAVYIPLPNSLHAPWIVRAARAGKHVLCEKPLFSRGAQLEEVEAAVGAAGVYLAEAFMYRHHPQLATVRELLGAGEVGELVTLQARLHFSLSRTGEPDIRLRPDMGGGALLDLGCYPVDLFGGLTGTDPDDVAAVAHREGGVDTRTAAVLRYGRVLATMDCSFDAPMLNTATLIGTEGTIRLTDAFRTDLVDGVGTAFVDNRTARSGSSRSPVITMPSRSVPSPGPWGPAGRRARLPTQPAHRPHPGADRTGGRPRLTGVRDHPGRGGDEHELRRRPVALYIDAADRRLIAELWSSGVFAGVTTNPTILDRAGLGQRDVPDLYAWLTDLGVGTVYLQVVGRTRDEMLRCAEDLRSLGPVTVKVPATPDGLSAAGALVREGARVLLTAVYHPVQALMARDCGIQGVAPYVGRMTDAGRDGVESVIAMQQAIGTEPTRILAASLRTADDVTRLAAAGVPDFTLGGPLAQAVLDDDLTRAAVDEFEAATARQS